MFDGYLTSLPNSVGADWDGLNVHQNASTSLALMNNVSMTQPINSLSSSSLVSPNGKCFDSHDQIFATAVLTVVMVIVSVC